jgi:hypothetical protein
MMPNCAMQQTVTSGLVRWLLPLMANVRRKNRHMTLNELGEMKYD